MNEDGGDVDVLEQQTLRNINTLEELEAFRVDPNRVTLTCFMMPNVPLCSHVNQYLTETAVTHASRLTIGKVDVRKVDCSSYELTSVPTWRVEFDGESFGGYSGSNTEKATAILRNAFESYERKLEERKAGPLGPLVLVPLRRLLRFRAAVIPHPQAPHTRRGSAAGQGGGGG